MVEICPSLTKIIFFDDHDQNKTFYLFVFSWGQVSDDDTVCLKILGWKIFLIFFSQINLSKNYILKVDVSIHIL